MSDTDDRLALFDSWAARYDAQVGAGEGFPFAGYRNVLSTIVRRSNAAPGDRVLDIGTGSGNLAALFAARGCLVTAIDFSAKMLAVARDKLPTAEFLRCDLSRDDDWTVLAGRDFDCVAASYVLHEFALPRVASIVRRLLDHHLPAHGCVIVGDIAFPSREILDAGRARWHEHWDDTEHYFAADETIATLAAVGLAATYEQVSACAGVFLVRRS